MTYVGCFYIFIFNDKFGLVTVTNISIDVWWDKWTSMCILKKSQIYTFDEQDILGIVEEVKTNS